MKELRESYLKVRAFNCLYLSLVESNPGRNDRPEFQESRRATVKMNYIHECVGQLYAVDLYRKYLYNDYS